MPTEEIIIEIDDLGNIKIDMIDFQGKICENIIDELANKVGEIVDDKKKPEYYKKVVQKQKQSNQIRSR